MADDLSNPAPYGFLVGVRDRANAIVAAERERAERMRETREGRRKLRAENRRRARKLRALWRDVPPVFAGMAGPFRKWQAREALARHHARRSPRRAGGAPRRAPRARASRTAARRASTSAGGRGSPPGEPGEPPPPPEGPGPGGDDLGPFRESTRVARVLVAHGASPWPPTIRRAQALYLAARWAS